MYWTAFIIAFVVTAAVSDLWVRKIPRALTLVGVVVGLAFHALRGGFVSSLIAMLIGFGVGLSFFWLGAIGGGDVKLITALGALLGVSRWLTAMEVTILVAALIALLQIIRRGAVRQTGSNILELLRSFRHDGIGEHAQINVRNAAMIRSPFGVSAAIGTILALAVRL